MRENLEPRVILLGHLQLLNQQLNAVENAFQRAEAIDPVLYERVRVPFANDLARLREDLGGLRARILASPQFYASWWDDLDAHREACSPLFAASLAFVQGALVRKTNLDDGLCAVADALLIQLAHDVDIPWKRLTLLAEVEFFAKTAEMVRIRFPEMSIWSLPIAAHEFGHYVGPLLKLADDSTPIADRLKQEENRWKASGSQLASKQPEIRQQAQKKWFYLHEYFADLYAAYTLGPAYACTCLLLRFDPRLAFLDSDDHPSFAARAFVILHTLRRVLQAEGQPSGLAQMIADLQTSWTKNLQESTQQKALSQPEQNELGKLANTLFGWLDTRKEARFTSAAWDHARQLSHLFEKQIISGSKQVTPPKSMIEILNGAWHWRIYHWDGENIYALHDIGRSAKQLCEKLL